ncbi:lamin tail domain-containing protein [Wukongibacter baidiensis]|uniref:lamin tail domain-containing protein n=1 Tax=Wukongibacter baidiensis TaxID=1723361 RepID=UPI003D7FD6D1
MNWKRKISFIIVFALVFSLLNFSGQAVAASNNDVVINEIAWMGTTYSYADEWIELYNNTNQSVDLSGWTLSAKDGTPSINLSGAIPANGYFLLERTDDTTVPEISSDLIYSGALGNTIENLELKDSSGSVIDTVDSWYAGDNGTKATMERISSTTSGTTSSNWKTATKAYDGGLGTPSNSSTPSGGSGGSWTPGNLEIHHINIGQGDATLVVSPSGKSLLLDAGESYWNSSTDAEKIGPYIENVIGSKELDYVLISHFHLDHIGYTGEGGLWHLVEEQGFTVGKMVHRDYNNYLGTTSGTFDKWKAYLEGEGKNKLNPEIAVEGTNQIDLGSDITVNIIATDGNGALIKGDFSSDSVPPSENDYSVGVIISFGDFDEWIGGDFSGEYATSDYGYTYHDIELSAAKEIGDVDVLRANHHGSDHSNNSTFVNQLDPEVSIISVGDDNTYGHPRQSVVDLLLSTSDLYLTEHGDSSTNIGNAIVAGDIVIKTSDGKKYTVNGTSYTATEPIRTDSDGDGYFNEVDPNDNDANTVPQPKGGTDPTYQP